MSWRSRRREKAAKEKAEEEAREAEYECSRCKKCGMPRRPSVFCDLMQKETHVPRATDPLHTEEHIRVTCTYCGHHWPKPTWEQRQAGGPSE
jgi:hypothetical protein